MYSYLEDFCKARTNHVSGVKKTRSPVRSLFDYKTVHLFEDLDVFKAFQNDSKHFEKDLKTEKKVSKDN